MNAADEPPILHLSGVTKSFGGTRALVSGELDLFPGSVTALIGENGAGKSTLVKILTGVHQPDGGRVVMDGKTVSIKSPDHAQQLGISVIHQESVVFDELSVAENIFITARPRKHGLISWSEMRKQAQSILTRLGSKLSVDTPLRELSIAQKHLVQIARALSHDARVVIMDEPTAALSHHEAQDLLQIVRDLRDQGRAILFITHKFDEVFAVADRYAVFRDGAAIEQGLLRDTSLDQLITLMVGRSIEQLYPKQAAVLGEEVLRVEQLSRASEFADINFNLQRGEILGVYGLVGAGRSELMQCIFGVSRADSGQIICHGHNQCAHHPDEAIAQGIVYVPEDRQHQGAIMAFSIGHNITLPVLGQFARGGWLNGRSEAATADKWAQRLQVKCASLEQPISELSGGNQQKVILAKWLLAAPQVLILDEPTKGIDVGSKSAVHALMSELAQQGLSIIMVSSELPEILGMSDRVMIMRRGRVAGVLDRAQADAEAVLRLATAA
jgi:rhamnose transport system ATP-binding protein